MEIALVIPTVRKDSYNRFKRAWKPFLKNIHLITVWDGDKPMIEYGGKMLNYESDLVYNKSDVVRNLGFLFAKEYIDPDIYITLDDDVLPHGDTIGDHIKALNMRFPKYWMSTATEYVRGVPYGVRDKRECVVSHGVWYGVKDWDAPTQLVRGNPDVEFYRGHIPHGVKFPFCGMNVAFKKKALPYMYYAPMGHRVGLDRFGDIWLGIELKKACDKKNWAIATGFSAVRHERASDVFKNLQKEAKGLEMNEHYGEDPYFRLYEQKRKEWYELISNL